MLAGHVRPAGRRLPTPALDLERWSFYCYILELGNLLSFDAPIYHLILLSSEITQQAISVGFDDLFEKGGLPEKPPSR